MKTLGGIKEALNRPASLQVGDGVRRVTYPTDRIDLRGEVAKHVVACGVRDPLPLEDLHHRIRPEYQFNSERRLCRASANIYGTVPGISHLYWDLVKYIAREILGFDIVFEANPPLRFHFPVSMPNRFRSKEGVLLAYHTDTQYGECFEGINCWVPFTRCFGTNALQCASLPDSISILSRFASDFDFDEATYLGGRELLFRKLYCDEDLQKFVLQSCQPVETDYGELLMFDSRTIHGTAENVEATTRVSLDFRIVALEVHEAIMHHLEAAGEAPLEFADRAMVRGAFYDERTAFQL